MKCMYCGCQDSKVLDSRPTDENNSIRRRRECMRCGRRFTTYEKIETMPVMVVKKDGSRQLFEIDKVRTGIIKACEKCKVSADEIETLVTDIDTRIHDRSEREVPSVEIGEMISEGLRNLDPIAYIRFSSVYREINDLNKLMELMEETNKMLKK